MAMNRRYQLSTELGTSSGRELMFTGKALVKVAVWAAHNLALAIRPLAPFRPELRDPIGPALRTHDAVRPAQPF